MEAYAKISKVYLKHHLKFYILAAVLLFCLMPFLMSTENLSPRESAKTLEMYAALLGVVLLVPIFMADQDKDIRDLLRSKRISLSLVHGIRVIESLLVLAAAEMACILFLKGGGCQFPLWSYFFGVLAGALFLGGLGMAIYSLTDNVAVGYMIPLVYYAINFSGDKYVKNFYLFSMTQGNFLPKYWLAMVGLLFLLFGVLWRRVHP
ncbi:MAG: hypothetical protein HFI63_11650 [Lachnospiraceae bacterium]|nr:hypothetical protein [Lachnospiraceae bacterium]